MMWITKEFNNFCAVKTNAVQLSEDIWHLSNYSWWAQVDLRAINQTKCNSCMLHLPITLLDAMMLHQLLLHVFKARAAWGKAFRLSFMQKFNLFTLIEIYVLVAFKYIQAYIHYMETYYLIIYVHLWLNT